MQVHFEMFEIKMEPVSFLVYLKPQCHAVGLVYEAYFADMRKGDHILKEVVRRCRCSGVQITGHCTGYYTGSHSQGSLIE